jgi:hypothetical protein
VGADHEAWAIERDLHRPVAIGPERRDATEGRERVRRGMTIPVPGSDRDQRDLRRVVVTFVIDAARLVVRLTMPLFDTPSGVIV